MEKILEQGDIIQVRTGDYRREWLEAVVLSVKESLFRRGEFRADVVFIEGDSKGYTQHIYDIQLLHGEDWRTLKEAEE